MQQQQMLQILQTPVEVKDLKSLTSDEKDKVADAVIEANPTIPRADIAVADDGTVTVKNNGKTGTLAPEKTVKQKKFKTTSTHQKNQLWLIMRKH